MKPRLAIRAASGMGISSVYICGGVPARLSWLQEVLQFYHEARLRSKSNGDKRGNECPLRLERQVTTVGAFDVRLC